MKGSWERGWVVLDEGCIAIDMSKKGDKDKRKGNFGEANVIRGILPCFGS
jgi:hypothetical protein